MVKERSRQPLRLQWPPNETAEFVAQDQAGPIDKAFPED